MLTRHETTPNGINETAGDGRAAGAQQGAGGPDHERSEGCGHPERQGQGVRPAGAGQEQGGSCNMMPTLPPRLMKAVDHDTLFCPAGSL